MRPFNLLFAVFMVLIGAFVAMTLQRLNLQDRRIFILEDRVRSIETSSVCTDAVSPIPVDINNDKVTL